jgi:glycosyltransferase involved in cell wall biosynthesis
MTTSTKPRALLIRVGRSDPPWWWQYVDHDALCCQLEVRTLPLAVTRPKSPFSPDFFLLALGTARIVLQARREGFAYVFTFENDWLTFLVAGLQTLLVLRRPRHVILQFIMRERTNTLRSRIKYAFMRWCFRSVHLCVCSSRSEADYYRRTFGWPPSKLAFVPLHTDPAFVERPAAREECLALAAGRTFRDYPTLLEAARLGLDLPLTIVAGRGSLGPDVPPSVTTLFDIPRPELLALLARAAIVVLPLQPREISIGQSVLLEAMAMGKAVIVTRVNGTVDYVEHMKTGMLIPPNDPAALRDAVNHLAGNPELRRRLGAAGRARVLGAYLPNHYAQGVARVLKELR